MTIRASKATGWLAALAMVTGCGGSANSPTSQGADPCGSSAPAPAEAETECGLVCRAVLPLDLSDGVPRVTAWVQGKPAKMLLDTGASVTSLTPPAAARLGLKVDSTAVGSVWGVGGSQEVGATGPVTLAFGNVSRTAVDMLVLTTHDQADADAPDGGIGADLMSHYEVDLDLPHNIARFYGGRPCPGALPGWRSDAVSLPMSHPLRGRQPGIPAALNGVALTALLDTGAAHSLVSVVAARQLGTSDRELKLEMERTLIGVGAGSLSARLLRFKSLQIGGETAANPDIDVAEMPFKVPEMVLGAEFMATHKVWLSFATRRVYLSDKW